MNYYETLGVEPGASADDIKRAYRRMAMKVHPDRTGGDDTEFKKLQEAYETLSDPDRRAEYDNPRPSMRPEFDFAGGDFNDIFAQMFGAGRRPARKNSDLLVNLQISLYHSYAGTDYILSTETGAVNIKIPAGVRPGTKLRVPGRGKQTHQNLPPGDLYVVVHVDMPPDWGRQDDDLYVRTEIDAISAMTGTSLELQHITGKKYKVVVPAGIQSGEKIRLKGLGMTNPGDQTLGSLYVIVTVVIPAITDTECLELLNKVRGKLNGQ